MTHGVALLADVTGRDLIVALARPGDAPGEHRVLPGSTSLELEAGLKSVLAELDADVLVGAAVAAAGPEIDGAVTLTSTGLTVSLTWLRHVLRTPRVYLVNDFTACAMGAPKVAEAALSVIHPGKAARNAAIAVLGPDIGLGVAGLAPLRGEGWLAVPSEGGHMDFCPVEAREAPIFSAVRARHGEVSAERLLSKEGLSDIHCALVGDGDPLVAPENDNVIIELARAGDAQAREAISIFSGLLGGFAGDMTLVFAARGGVFLNSPLLEAIGGLLDREAFVRRYRTKGRMSPYLAEVPVFSMPGRSALLGLSSLFSPSDMRYAASDVKFLDC
ncbi:glucokinase [Caulobacter rhizosphaerae]|jgi:glucokinase|uniref:glucokinase n=1 Tax=Caulobacter rhizosphaerae TaxID=2010972 RepID=UPI0013D55DEF|nr:glucokinase [Caulobacter rhizosphaerae]GGL42924.1 glucokinase [Caulobacter rhizosphaerae]